jgi:hypothetical protein
MISWFQSCGKTGDQSRTTFFGIHFSLVNRNLVIHKDPGINKKCKEIRKHFEMFRFVEIQMWTAGFTQWILLYLWQSEKNQTHNNTGQLWLQNRNHYWKPMVTM